MSQERILIIEDEKSLSEVLEYNLTREGYQVFTAVDGREGLDKARILQPDLVVLDIMLPSLDGLQICSELRSSSQTQDIRILLLTAKEEEVDEVVGFSMGADDYVIKPYRLRPLLHRIKALLRRDRTNLKQNSVVEKCGVRVDGLNYAAWIEGREIVLTPTELKLLWFLMKEPERTYSRLELLEACRGEDNSSTERTIDVHVRSIRRKLEARAGLLQTVRGVGYRFTPLNEYEGDSDKE
ncbi:MAG: DNA-binding response regulator [Planctomycetaceae bacterium]|nr:DNA-binding response regulator [Planctomycetaceae bacterium]